MDKQFYQVITDGVFEALKDKSYKLETFEKGEYFSNGEKAFMIDYDEEKSLISLKTAILEEGEGVEFKELSSWLMGEDATDRDLLSIKNDLALEFILAETDSPVRIISVLSCFLILSSSASSIPFSQSSLITSYIPLRTLPTWDGFMDAYI